MRLLTQAQHAQLLDNGRRQAAAKGTDNAIDFKPVVKLVDLCGSGTWFLTEIDPDDPDIAWGLWQRSRGQLEFHTISLRELETPRNKRFFDRDLAFEADKTIVGYVGEAMRLHRIRA